MGSKKNLFRINFSIWDQKIFRKVQKKITTVFDEDIKDYDISKSKTSITKVKEVDGNRLDLRNNNQEN